MIHPSSGLNSVRGFGPTAFICYFYQ